jgi:hypothetical protein
MTITHRRAALWARDIQAKVIVIISRSSVSGSNLINKMKNVTFSGAATSARMPACMHDDTCNHNRARNNERLDIAYRLNSIGRKKKRSSPHASPGIDWNAAGHDMPWTHDMHMASKNQSIEHANTGRITVSMKTQ